MKLCPNVNATFLMQTTVAGFSRNIMQLSSKSIVDLWASDTNTLL